MNEEMKKVTLDGVEYEIDSLSDKAVYIVELLSSLQGKERNLLMEMDQIKAAQNDLTARFKAEVSND